MTHPRLVLAAGSVAASLVAIAPVGMNAHKTASAPIRVGGPGIAVSSVRIATTGAKASLVVPQGMTRLAGTPSGSPAVTARTRLTIVRSADDATVFTGSLATFKSLSVAPGTKLVVSVQRPVGLVGLKAVALLRWS
jgi:hypothetical protein